jgi:ribosome-binding ATPase YchF (GTP1/OBG family)
MTAMRIGLVGYQGSGKTTLFQWLTGAAPDPHAVLTTGQIAMAPIPDDRVAPLCQVYHPKKVTLAALEIVDTPGLLRSHEGNATRLSLIREADCLVMVVPVFAGADAKRELSGFAEDLLLADMEIVSRRIEKLRESTRKRRPHQEAELAELAELEPLLAALEAGKAVAGIAVSEEQRRLTRSFRLFAQKPRLVVFNLADDDTDAARFAPMLRGHSVTGSGSRSDPATLEQGQPYLAAPLSLELELAKMNETDRAEFERDLALKTPRRTDFLRTMLDVSHQILFFTAGEKEVRTWLLPKGGTAVDAAGNIHTDLARGFIRAEVMRVEDLIRLGSEREIKAHNLLRHEHKDYQVREGDVLLIRHN